MNLQVWDIHSLNNPIATLEPSGEPTFYTNNHRHFLVTTRPDSDNKAIVCAAFTFLKRNIEYIS